jgi:UDP-glucose 4-epimerase
MAPVLAGCVKVKEAYQQVFNIGADREYTVNELARQTMEAMGMSGEIRYLEARNEVVHAHADHSKAKKVFGMNAATSLEEGLGKMADWAKKAGIRKSSRFRDIEITEKLPPVWLE